MPTQLAVVMDPIESIHTAKDSTFAILMEAQARGWSLLYAQQQDLYVEDGEARGRLLTLRVNDDPQHWFTLGEAQECRLGTVEAILMRKDPPFDMEYLYSTYVLELAAAQGSLVVNDPRGLRDANEKLFTAWFPQCCVPTLVSRSQRRFRGFLEAQRDIIIKPLHSMGGESVFRIRQGDPNTNVILETLTRHDTRTVMAQRYIPEVIQGDKRVLMIDGTPVPYALARLPAEGEARANLAAGGTGQGVALSERDRWICAQLGPVLRERGLLFVGLDLIGDYLTEINVTSPTCIRELDRIYGLNISARIMDAIEARLRHEALHSAPQRASAPAADTPRSG
jgi:glutathione synthase